MIIIQPNLPSYRYHFFCCLAEGLNKKITVLHFGQKSNLIHPLINEEIGDYRKFGSFKFVLNLSKLIEEYSTVITVFDPHWINLFTLPLFQKKRKIVLWGHGLGKNNFINKVRVVFIKKAFSFITYSEERKERLLNSGINRTTVYVAHNTLAVVNLRDTSSFSKKKFLYVGRLQRRKKLDIFFDIFDALKLGELGYSVDVVGDGLEEKKYLKDRVVRLGLTKYVSFKEGTTSETKLIEYFSHAKYYISPGAVGLGVLHSFAYGVPVLTMIDEDHGPEVDNIQNGINGQVFYDEIDFRNSLYDFLNANIAEKMGQNAFRHYRQERSVQVMVDDFIKAIL